MNNQEIAKNLELELTADGDIILGSNDQGQWNPPGGQVTNLEVAFYLQPCGEFEAVIDNQRGSNQGRVEYHSGKIEGESLDEVISLTEDHTADNPGLVKACRLAASAARSTLRKIEKLNA